jgi:hypothetical protein
VKIAVRSYDEHFITIQRSQKGWWGWRVRRMRRVLILAELKCRRDRAGIPAASNRFGVTRGTLEERGNPAAILLPKNSH